MGMELRYGGWVGLRYGYGAKVRGVGWGGDHLHGIFSLF